MDVQPDNPFDAPGTDSRSQSSGCVHLALRVGWSLIAVPYGALLSLVAGAGLWSAVSAGSIHSAEGVGALFGLGLFLPAVVVAGLASALALMRKRWAVTLFVLASSYFILVFLLMLVATLATTVVDEVIWVGLSVVGVPPVLLVVAVAGLVAIQSREQYAFLTADDDV